MLGIGTTVETYYPQYIFTLSNVQQLSAGSHHTLAIGTLIIPETTAPQMTTTYQLTEQQEGTTEETSLEHNSEASILACSLSSLLLYFILFL